MLGNFARLQGVRKKPASEVTDAGFNPYALVSAEDSPAHQGQEETTGGKDGDVEQRNTVFVGLGLTCLEIENRFSRTSGVLNVVATTSR